MTSRITLILASLLVACQEPTVVPGDDAGMDEPDAGGEGMGLAVLGFNSHSVEFVELTELADGTDTLSVPRDLAVHPTDPTELWVVNEPTSVSILRGIDTDEPEGRRYGAPGSEHFLTRPAAIAFGDSGFMATAPETDHRTQLGTPVDFMGPTLWPSTSDPTCGGISQPVCDDLSMFDAGHASHMDMLHNSPNSVGVAWEDENIYWIVDGAHESLTRYDFRNDHGPGGEDHTDGIVERYAEGMLGYVEDVSSHIEMDRAQGLLYVADTGNNRVAVFDPSSADRGSSLTPNYDGSDQFHMNGGELTTLVNGADHDMERPSGLALHDGIVFVTDNATSRIYAFDQATGARLDYLDLSSVVDAGGLMGIEVEADGRLLIVDSVGSRVFRVGPHRH